MPLRGKRMGRIERRKNPVARKVLKWLLLLTVMIIMVYGYLQIPRFVVKRNLTLQHSYTYESYDAVLEKRETYLTKEYMERFETYPTLIGQKEYIKEHKETCRLIRLELGKRKSDGSIPYEVIYELSYADGETPTQRIHVEGYQMLEKDGWFWWRVNHNVQEHACTDLNMEEQKEEEHTHK